MLYNQFRETLEQVGAPLCRHTFASLMASAEVQPAIITETAGHEDYSTTMLYTHVQLKEKIDAVNKVVK